MLLGAGANGADLGTIRHSLTMVAIESGVEIEALTLAAPKIELQGFTVINLTALPGVDLPGLKLSGMKTGYPLRLSATPARGVIDLDGSSFDASTVVSARFSLYVRVRGTLTPISGDPQAQGHSDLYRRNLVRHTRRQRPSGYTRSHPARRFCPGRFD